jgi:hypothetical protein
MARNENQASNRDYTRSMKTKRAVDSSTALIAKEEKEAPYFGKYTIDTIALLDGDPTTALRNAYDSS